ncbi:hypothetical protein LZ554_007080 [Drepanopeziza brunnea f. sp. 'monogermtubi']|nr:hypothetical protein LZ554_007080 [Drepanopeziza brunnea f. sp. 'monogermtubi']
MMQFLGITMTGRDYDPKPLRERRRHVSFALDDIDDEDEEPIKKQELDLPEEGLQDSRRLNPYLLFAIMLAIVGFWLRVDYALANSSQTPVVCYLPHWPRPEKCSEAGAARNVRELFQSGFTRWGAAGRSSRSSGTTVTSIHRVARGLEYVNLVRKIHQVAVDNHPVTELLKYGFDDGDDFVWQWSLAGRGAGGLSESNMIELRVKFHRQRSNLPDQFAQLISNSESMATKSLQHTAQLDFHAQDFGRKDRVYGSRRVGTKVEDDIANAVHDIFAMIELRAHALRRTIDRMLPAIAQMELTLNTLAHPQGGRPHTPDMHALQDEELWRTNLQPYMKDRLDAFNCSAIAEYAGAVARARNAVEASRELLGEYEIATRLFLIPHGSLILEGTNVDAELQKWIKSMRYSVAEWRENFRPLSEKNFRTIAGVQ